MNLPQLPRAWWGVELRVEFGVEVTYARSVMDACPSLNIGMPTEEERVRGYAERKLVITADQVWRLSTCLDCGLPLVLHPEERKGDKSRRRYCRIARRAARLSPKV